MTCALAFQAGEASSSPAVRSKVVKWLAQLPQMEGEPEDVITIPAHLQRKIKAAQKVDPTMPRDAAPPQIVARKAAWR